MSVIIYGTIFSYLASFLTPRDFPQKPSPDIKGPLYSLLYNILLHNWKMFFKPAFVRSLDSPAPGDDVLCRAEFLAIMHAFGQSFLQPDIAIFRQNLNALEHLNANRKLYKKVGAVSLFFNSIIQ
jgi:hypothetical protein